jgi:hypothetical protein
MPSNPEWHSGPLNTIPRGKGVHALPYWGIKTSKCATDFTICTETTKIKAMDYPLPLQLHPVLSSISPSIPLQSSSHSVYVNVGRDNYIMKFD